MKVEIALFLFVFTFSAATSTLVKTEKGLTSSLIRSKRGWLNDFFSGAQDKIKDAAENVGDKFKDIAEDVEDGAQDVGSKIKDAAENVGDKVKDIAADVEDIALDAGGKIKDFSEDVADKVVEATKKLEAQYHEAKNSFGAIQELATLNFDVAVAKLVHLIDSQGTQVVCNTVCEQLFKVIIGPVPVLPGVVCPPLCKGALALLKEISLVAIQEGDQLAELRTTPAYCPCPTEMKDNLNTLMLYNTTLNLQEEGQVNATSREQLNATTAEQLNTAED